MSSKLLTNVYNFSLPDFISRLLDVVEKSNKTISEVGREAGIQNLHLYTQSNAKIPRAETLYKLAMIGLDINYLLTGASIILENTEFIKRLEKLEQDVQKLKADNYDLIEENKKLRMECLEKDKENLILRVNLEKDISNNDVKRMDKSRG